MISSIVLPINALFAAMADVIDFAPIYSELDIQSMVTRYRAHSLHSNPHDNLPKVMFGFQRTPLIKYDVLGGKGKWSSPRTGTGSATTEYYKALYGQLTINFAAYFKNMLDLEEFEMAMACGGGITSIKRVTVDIPELSDEPFAYPIDWEDIDTIEMPDNDIYKMGLTGMFFIRGFFFTFGENHPAVKTINAKIANYNELVFGSDGRPLEPQPVPNSMTTDFTVTEQTAQAYHDGL